MSVVFYCEGCGSRFEAPEALAGKQGKCRKCGRRVLIPTEASGRASARVDEGKAPALVRKGQGAAATRAEARPIARPTTWIEAVNSRVALAPISTQHAPAIPRREVLDALADTTSSALYKLAEPLPGKRTHAPREQVSGAKIAWRQMFGLIRSLMRRINEYAYLASLPFLFLILFGAISGSRPLAITGATLVVLLNLSRLGAGLFDLGAVAFRDGIAQGVMFLIPPLTFVYLANHWHKTHRALKRIIEPVVTIGLVVLAFTFIPSLNGGAPAQGSAQDKIRSSAQGLNDEIKGKLRKGAPFDFESIESEAQKAIKELRKDAGGDRN